MPHWLEPIADDLPLITDIVLILGGIVLALWIEKIGPRARKAIFVVFILVALAGFVVRHFQAKQAGQDTKTLLGNTQTLLGDTKAVLEQTQTLFGVTKAVSTMQKQLDEVNKRIAVAKVNPTSQNQVAINQEIANAAQTLLAEFRQLDMRYAHEVSTNRETHMKSCPPQKAVQCAQEEAAQLQEINSAYRRDLHQYLEFAEHLRVLLTQNQVLSPEDKKYAEIIQEGLDGRFQPNAYPALGVGSYVFTLAQRRLKSERTEHQ